MRKSTEPDKDGFVTVTRKGKREATQKEQKTRKNLHLQYCLVLALLILFRDFYKFQNREVKREGERRVFLF